jgi:hypothetical protein
MSQRSALHDLEEGLSQRDAERIGVPTCVTLRSVALAAPYTAKGRVWSDTALDTGNGRQSITPCQKRATDAEPTP